MMKSILKFILKFSFTFIIFYYLITKGKVSFDKLNLFVENPSILFLFLFLNIFIVVPLCAFRWNLFLKGAGVEMKFGYALILTWIGNFFNSALPGAVSGDLIKGYYISKSLGKQSKTVTFVTLLIDRLVGLFALIILAFVGMIMNVTMIENNPILQTLSLFITCAFAGTICFYLLLITPINFSRFTFLNKYKDHVIISKFAKMYKALKLYQDKKMILLSTLVISIFSHSLTALIFLSIAGLFNIQNFHYLQQLYVMPLGLITTVIPIAPGGVGVGHVAFETLYKLMNISDGANIFNLYVVVQLGIYLLGAIPYMLHKNKPSSEELKQSQVA